MKSDVTKIRCGIVAIYIDDESGGDGDVDRAMENQLGRKVEIIRADIHKISIWK